MIESIESAGNEAAIRLEREMGFVAEVCPGDPTVRIVRKTLAPVPVQPENIA